MSRYVERLRGEPTSEKFLAFVVLLTSCGGSGVGRDDESGVSGPLNIGRAPPDDLLTISQVAAQLSVSPDTVRKWVRNGALTATRIGPQDAAKPRLRVRRDDLDQVAPR
jgi:excisionase family DNA binding protein